MRSTVTTSVESRGTVANRRDLTRFALAWSAIAWFPLFLPSIQWHAYYACLGALERGSGSRCGSRIARASSSPASSASGSCAVRRRAHCPGIGARSGTSVAPDTFSPPSRPIFSGSTPALPHHSRVVLRSHSEQHRIDCRQMEPDASRLVPRYDRARDLLFRLSAPGERRAGGRRFLLPLRLAARTDRDPSGAGRHRSRLARRPRLGGQPREARDAHADGWRPAPRRRGVREAVLACNTARTLPDTPRSVGSSPAMLREQSRSRPRRGSRMKLSKGRARGWMARLRASFPRR